MPVSTPSPEPAEETSLQAALLASARRHRDRRIALLDNRGRIAEARSFPELVDSLRLGAGRLVAAGVAPGDRVIVCLPTSWQWLETWFGALLLGALPVSVAPPGALGSPAAQIRKALEVAARLDAAALVAGETFLRDAGEILAEDGVARRGDPTAVRSPGPTRWLAVESLSRTSADPVDPALPADPEQIAFLQLTSGSTGLPRAAEISHRAVLHNVRAMGEAVDSPHGGEPTRRMVSWLPLYHDMGLVGCLVNSLLRGFDLDLLTPRAFLARPWIWLEAISRYPDGAVLSTAPNFAYQLCVERTPAGLEGGLDLTGWRDAMTGSEMVKPETAAAFCDRFAAAGFTPPQLRPCYGMAETTLATTFDRELAGPRVRAVPGDASVGVPAEVVCCGRAIIDSRVRVLDPRGAALPAEAIGRVQVRSPSLFSGYYQDPQATAEALRDGWLETGDLGFLDADGELYLTGRSKELLILHGQNVMPHELEWIAEAELETGGSQRCAAFSVPGQTGEEPVLVMETSEEDATRLADEARRVAGAIGRALGVPLRDTVWVRRGAIPRTSSGKIQRQAVRDLYLEGQLERRA
ncbi:MAG: hypothetical protein DWQ36_15755 [Acidobacteria bacterium]|nr:MAG: hypothetical protein DWQ30_14430 [Acidobacteriota bacterium]REK05567.1 MAG: hypothetical protein DWQ36_15755 [Acidobacteriota bacterium]